MRAKVAYLWFSFLQRCGLREKAQDDVWCGIYNRNNSLVFNFVQMYNTCSFWTKPFELDPHPRFFFPLQILAFFWTLRTNCTATQRHLPFLIVTNPLHKVRGYEVGQRTILYLPLMTNGVSNNGKKYAIGDAYLCNWMNALKCKNDLKYTNSDIEFQNVFKYLITF